jgi:DNA (cytosine-5)-methyltransferase 1
VGETTLEWTLALASCEDSGDCLQCEIICRAADEDEQMKTRSPDTPMLFPELATGPENPWITASAKRFVERSANTRLTTLELCAGGGGQAIGLEQAGFDHVGLVEIDRHACATLRLNRPDWNVIEEDLNTFDGSAFNGIDLISGGLPCPPFSVAGKQLGKSDERNLFPAMIRLVAQIRPRAVMIENVRGFLDAVFEDYRGYVRKELEKLGYRLGWKLMNASDFGVPQLRPRVVFVAVRKDLAENFAWPQPLDVPPKTVGQTLYDLMARNGWKGAKGWAELANDIAPTIVGGSHKHGGPDLGPTRARKAWATLGVDGLGIADQAPGPDFVGMPRLTVRMVARLQGFPDEWQFAGSKTQAYRQVGNAFPPPFARAVAESLRACLSAPRLVRVAG